MSEPTVQIRSRDSILTPKQLAEEFDKNERVTESWRRNGNGPPYFRPTGRCVYYKWGDVLDWLEKSRVENTAQESNGSYNHLTPQHEKPAPPRSGRRS